MIQDLAHHPLCDFPLFQGLSSSTVECVAAKIERRSFRKGTTILMMREQSHSVLFVETGLVRVCDRSCPTNDVLIAMLGPQEILGEIHALDGQGHSADVVAVEDTICWLMPMADFLDCLEQFPEMTLNLLRLTVKRLRYTTERIALLSTQDTMGRLARQLQILASQCGVPTVDGAIEIPLPLTQADLAALTGVSRQSINSAFSTFRAQNAIECRGNHIVILRPDLLENRCR